MDKHIPGFKIASGSLKGRKTTDDIKKVKRKHLKFDATVMPDEDTAWRSDHDIGVIESSAARIIRFETAEREARRLIKSVFQEAIQHLNSANNMLSQNKDSFDELQQCQVKQYPISDMGGWAEPVYSAEDGDLMEGLLLLANIYRRIDLVKKALQEDLNQLQKTFQQREKKARATIETLQATILHLQAENHKAKDNISEMRILHEIHARKLVEEAASLHQELNVAKTEVHRMRSKIHEQTQKIMDIPRLEEACFRAARGLVKQSEATLMMKEIGWRRLKEEVKTLESWKLKAKTLEDCVLKQNSMIEDLTAQSKLNFKRYQSLLIINAQRERRNTIRPDLHPNLIPSFSTRVAQHTPAANKSESDSSSSLSNVSDGNRQKKKKKIKKRPLSAPPGGRLGSVKHTHSSLEKDGVKPTTISSSKRKTNITNSNYLAALNAASGGNLKKDDMLEILQEEILKLRGQLSQKDAKIKALFRSLSNARAYPLLSQEPDEDNNNIPQTHDAVRRKPPKQKDEKMTFAEKIFAELDEEIANDDADLASGSTNLKEEEERVNRSRLDAAVAAQQEFWDRMERRKSISAPHIQAIRNSRSFSVPDDLIII